MDKHVRALGILNIVFGITALIAMPGWLIAGEGFRGIYRSFNEPVLGIVAAVLCGFLILIAIPCILGGALILRYAEAGRVVLTIASALNLLNIPLGTLLGGYGLWVLTTPETDPLFQHRPEDRRSTRVPTKKKAAAESSKERSARIIPSPLK